MTELYEKEEKKRDKKSPALLHVRSNGSINMPMLTVDGWSGPQRGEGDRQTGSKRERETDASTDEHTTNDD
jgi:hypothetical protein